MDDHRQHERRRRASCGGQEVHKFDQAQDRSLSVRQLTRMHYSRFFYLIRSVWEEAGKDELIRLLDLHSAPNGRQVGTQQALNSPDTEFQTLVATFGPPRYARTPTHDVVEDTEDTSS